MSDTPPSSTFHFDALLILLFPGTAPPKDTQDRFHHVYSATLTNPEGRILHIDVTLTVLNASTMLLPHKTSAHVVGTAAMTGNRMSVAASSVSRGPTGMLTPQLEALLRPVVLFGGVVTGRSLNDGIGTPSGLQVVEITVKRTKDWPHAPITIVCKLDGENEHVKSLDNVDLDTLVIVSGTLIGINNGKLEVSIHDIGLRDDEFVCTTPSLASGFACVLGAAALPCRWFAAVIRRGLEASQGRAGSKRSRHAETDENSAS